jgi:hypothetical protein
MYYFLMFFLMSSCANFLNLFDDNLQLKREEYQGDQLKINGYFFEKDTTYGDVYNFYVLYNNGVVLNIGASRDFNYHKEKFKKNDFDENYNLGVFQINQDSIKFERWYPGEISKCYIREGKILNDTTFEITESYRLKGRKKTERKERSEIYHFIQFNPKPDSTNCFIK